MEEQKNFRERLANDIKTAKKMLYMEELKSFLAALGFAGNAACLALFPFTIVSVLNILALFYCMKQFKPTVKKQILYGKHLEFLKTIKNEKVWTQSDK